MNLQTPLRMTLLLWVGSLFALLGMQRFFVEPLPSLTATIAVFIVQVAPLLMVIPGALRKGSKGPLWVCLVILLYFVHGVWQAASHDARLIGILEVIFALGAFVTAWILLKVMPKEDGGAQIG